MGRWSLGLLAALVLVAGCKKKPPPPTNGGGPPTTNNTPRTDGGEGPVAGATELDPTTLKEKGSVKVTVKWSGEAPKLRDVVHNHEYCKLQHPDGRSKSEELILNGNQTVRDVYVRVSKGLSKYTFKPNQAEFKVTQNGCLYKPHIIAVMTGQPVSFLNDDDTMHNVKHDAAANLEWTRNEDKKGDSYTHKFDQEEIMGRMRCNVHAWMEAVICVSRHPYFGLTGESGEVLLENLPPGKYTIEAHQEKYGKQSAEVTVENGKTAELTFTFEKK